ncbi:MAG: hypothetical protein HC903_16790 [Methylacidiphilales bacterium]|nr:hypothetical protein [Candidatus Methylacidiphilales bacterium]NJR18117.1 hypothetical protein [Calothrix sp. CSU_2_0]
MKTKPSLIVKRQILLALLFVTFSGTATAIAQTSQQQGRQPEMGEMMEAEPAANYTHPTTYPFPDNSQLDTAKFNGNLKKIEGRKIRDGLKLKSIRLMPYAKYVENRKKYGGGDLENLMVSPKRQIFLMEVHAPDGVEVPNRGRSIIKDKPAIGKDGQDIKNPPKLAEESKPLKFKKSKLFLVFDAETGEYFGSDIFEVTNFEEPK